jgi:hypothetical protein
MDFGTAAQSSVFLSHRTEHRDRRAPRRSQSSSVQEATRLPCQRVREDRPSGDEAATADSVRVRRVAQSPSRRRLSRGGRAPLLQRAACTRASGDHRAADRNLDRVPLQGPACRRARAFLRARQTHHDPGAHARLAPSASGVDAGPAAELGPEDRHGHTRRRAVAAGESSASGAGLSRLPGPAEPR